MSSRVYNDKNMKIIYENDNFIAVNKPASLLVHPTTKKRKDEEHTLVDEVFRKYPEIKNVGDNPDLRPGIVHRLDKDTSGIIVICKTQEFFNYFKKLLKEKKVEKRYVSLVWGKVEKEGVIKKDIGLKPNTTKQTVHTENAKMVKSAITKYKRIKTFEKDDNTFSLVELVPVTGRTHQLRVHMSSIHHSIVGDNMYGKTGNTWGLETQLLHARSLEFNLMESKRRIKLEADLPGYFVDTLVDLGLTQETIHDILK